MRGQSSPNDVFTPVAEVPPELLSEAKQLLETMGTEGDHYAERHRLWSGLVPQFYYMNPSLCYRIRDGWLLEEALDAIRARFRWASAL